MEVKEYISNGHMKFINPYVSTFWKIGHVYLVLIFEDQMVKVLHAQSTGKRPTGDWVELFISKCKDWGSKGIEFNTAVSNKVMINIAIQHGAKEIKRIPNFYGDEDAIIFFLNQGA